MGVVFWKFADNGTPHTLRRAVAACAASTGGLKAILVLMTAGTVFADFVIMVSTVIVGVVSGCGMTGLANPVPGGAIFIKSEMFGILLKYQLGIIKLSCN